MNEGENKDEPRSGIANFINRRHPRFSVHLPIKYWTGTGSESLFSRTVDISEGGLMVSLPEPIEIGQNLKLKLFYAPSSNELSTIEVCVQVVWRDIPVDKNGYYKTGVKFIEVSPEELDRWKSFLNILQIS